MITEKARIVAFDNEEVWLESQRYSACQTCKVKAGCGQKLVNDLSGGTRNLIRVPATEDLIAAELNQEVDVSIEEGSLVGFSLLVYLFPLVFLLIGAVTSAELQPFSLSPDLSALVGAFAGFSIAFFLSRALIRKIWTPGTAREARVLHVQTRSAISQAAE